MNSNKKGAGLPGLAVFLLAMIALAAVGGVGYWIFDKETKSTEEVQRQIEGAVEYAGAPQPVDQLSVLQIDKYAGTTEGGDDLEFWAKDANVADTTLTPKETIDLSSGAATDTSVTSLRSTYTDADMDLWIEGTGNFYDDKVEDWKFAYSEFEANAVLIANGQGGAVEAADVGAFADIDTPEAVGTGFVSNLGLGQVNYSDTTGADGGYFDIEIGNSEQSSELRDAVFCLADVDGDLEGNEITSMTVSKMSGISVGMPTNILPLFSQAAGSGAPACAELGDLINLKDQELKQGIYRVTFVVAEGNTDAGNEEFEIELDDLGGIGVRQYPSGNVKAANEDLVVAFVA